MLGIEELKRYSKALLPIIKRRSVSKKPWDTQTIYGDLLDYIRDYHMELRNADHDDDLVAHYAIGEYVINNNIRKL